MTTQPRKILDDALYQRPNDAALLVGLSRSTIDRMATSGEITRIKRGCATLIEMSELYAAIKQGTE